MVFPQNNWLQFGHHGQGDIGLRMTKQIKRFHQIKIAFTKQQHFSNFLNGSTNMSPILVKSFGYVCEVS